MSPHQRTARSAYTAALAAVSAAWWSADAGMWLLAVVFAYVGLLCTWTGHCHVRLHRREYARHDRARQASGTGGPLLERPVPCCSFWQHSDGSVHAPGCPRLDVEDRVCDGRPLDASERAAFKAIADHYDHGSRA